MKNIFCIMLLICFAVKAQAQDIILKRNGEEIKAKVLAVNPSDIRYKSFDNLEGPDKVILKADVFMITYANGTKEVIEQNDPPKRRETERKETARRSSRVDDIPEDEPIHRTVELSGPRIGVTFVGPGKTRKDLEDLGASHIFSQFGWQFETKFFTTSKGTSGMVEFIPLIGGLEQGKFLPSLSGLIAIRQYKGFEFGVGPNVSLAGASLVFAAGASFHSDGVNFPVNLAVVPSPNGTRFSLVVGFNTVKSYK